MRLPRITVLPSLCLLLLAPFANAQEDSFRERYKELMKQMTADMDAAIKQHEESIAADPKNVDLQILRQTIATQLTRLDEYGGANEQLSKLLEFQLANMDVDENRYGIWMTIQSIQGVASRSGNNKTLESTVQKGLTALSEWAQKSSMEQRADIAYPLSQLVALRAQHLADNREEDAARKLIENQITTLTEINKSDSRNQFSMQAFVMFLVTLARDSSSNRHWQEEMVPKLDKLISFAITQYPDSPMLQNQYANIQLQMITIWGQSDADENEKRIETVIKNLQPMSANNRSVQAILRRIDLLRERMSSAPSQSSLVGNPAPEWDVDGWINTIHLDRNDLDGKVVLLDFWAVWCGPCIATFPHLREWREQYGGQGFEIVGATRYYNYTWDEMAKRPERSGEPVDPSEERAAVASFLQHHKIEHPVLVAPKDSEMFADHGVRGIPHVVLIDRKGIIRLVKTGAGQATANEIAAKIEELLAEDTSKN